MILDSSAIEITMFPKCSQICGLRAGNSGENEAITIHTLSEFWVAAGGKSLQVSLSLTDFTRSGDP